MHPFFIKLQCFPLHNKVHHGKADIDKDVEDNDCNNVIWNLEFHPTITEQLHNSLMENRFHLSNPVKKQNEEKEINVDPLHEIPIVCS